MPTVYAIQKRVLMPLTLLVLLGFLLAACGAASTSTGGSGTAGATPTTAPVTVKGYGSANGCPSDMVVAGASSRANVTLLPSDANTTVTAHNGDVIEVRLPFGQRWNGPIVSQGILQLQAPAGYALKTNNVCVWRFVAQGTGSVTLNFTGRAICKKGQMCPMFIMAVPFKIDVM